MEQLQPQHPATPLSAAPPVAAVTPAAAAPKSTRAPRGANRCRRRSQAHGRCRLPVHDPASGLCFRHVAAVRKTTYALSAAPDRVDLSSDLFGGPTPPPSIPPRTSTAPSSISSPSSPKAASPPAAPRSSPTPSASSSAASSSWIKMPPTNPAKSSATLTPPWPATLAPSPRNGKLSLSTLKPSQRPLHERFDRANSQR